MKSKDWVGTAFIDGQLDWNKKQQTNTFGMTDSSETYFHYRENDFTEFNILDNSNEAPFSAAMTGYGIWKNSKTGGCGYLRKAGGDWRGNNNNAEDNTKISIENQLVLMVR